jgi:transcriptional regulator with XRE-family HTH domain
MPPQRTGATPERLALAVRVAELRANGLTYREVAVELGISRSYASGLAIDPDGSGDRERKDRYQGTCRECGAPTTGSDGRALAPTRCANCEARYNHESRYWTRERIIDAIQQFAAVHGRPPIADEWIRPDHEHGYPARSTVYNSHNGRKDPPFEKWADAIEASGFPRPTTRRRTMTEQRKGYVVLQETEAGVWTEIGTYDQGAQILALNAALDGVDPVGRWVAIPGRYWAPRSLQPKTIYEFVSE